MRGKKKKKSIKEEDLISRIKNFQKKKFFESIVLKKKKEKTLEDKLKEKKKTKEISDAVEKESKGRFKKNFDPGYVRFKNSIEAIYRLHEEFGEGFYRTKIDYEQLFSYLGSGVKLEYGEGGPVQEGLTARKGEMNFQEAEKTIQKIQYSLILKSSEGVAIEEKERFSYWQEFNKVLLMLYHKNSSIRTDEINYGAINQGIYT